MIDCGSFRLLVWLAAKERKQSFRIMRTSRWQSPLDGHDARMRTKRNFLDDSNTRLFYSTAFFAHRKTLLEKGLNAKVRISKELRTAETYQK